MNVVVDGLMTNYQKTGDGPKTVVLLHGWGQGLDSFKDLATELARNYTVLSVDLPGFNGTEGPKQPWYLDDYAKFIRNWLKKISAGKIYAIIGHSNGGAIAIRALSQGTVKADRLVLIASSGVRNRRKLKRLALKSLSKTGKIITAPLPAPAKRKLRKKFYAQLGSDIGLFPAMEDTFRNIISQDIQADARTLKLPTLLIYGSEDTQTPQLFGRLLHKHIAGSQLEIIPGVGHFVHQESPEAVNQLVKSFLGDK